MCIVMDYYPLGKCASDGCHSNVLSHVFHLSGDLDRALKQCREKNEFLEDLVSDDVPSHE